MAAYGGPGPGPVLDRSKIHESPNIAQIEQNLRERDDEIRKPGSAPAPVTAGLTEATPAEIAEQERKNKAAKINDKASDVKVWYRINVCTKDNKVVISDDISYEEYEVFAEMYKDLLNGELEDNFFEMPISSISSEHRMTTVIALEEIIRIYPAKIMK